jgi:hypothetical protein
MIEAYAFREKADLKKQIIASFYSAYFSLKGQKGLKGKDLEEVLNKIDSNENKEMTAEEIFSVCKAMAGGE